MIANKGLHCGDWTNAALAKKMIFSLFEKQP